MDSMSIWQLILTSAPASEHDEMARAIGQKLIDHTETLHAEVTALIEIWRDYRETILEEEALLKVKQEEKEAAKAALPEPPMVREVLKREISFFVESLQAKNAAVPTDSSSSKIVSYALDRFDTDQRPSSTPGLNRPSTANVGGREMPLRPMSSRSEGHPAVCRSKQLREELSDSGGQLSLFTFDGVVNKIREAIADESEALARDSQFLQECLEGEHDHRLQMISETSVGIQEPSILDMRQLRARLEKAYFASDGASSSSTSNKLTKPRRPSGPLAPARPGSAMRRLGSNDTEDKSPRRSSGEIKKLPAQPMPSDGNGGAGSSPRRISRASKFVVDAASPITSNGPRPPKLGARPRPPPSHRPSTGSSRLRKALADAKDMETNS